MKSHVILFGIACWLLFVFTVPASVFYVDVNSTNPVPPFTDWSTAATNIQNALDLATNGDEVLVTNGIYGFGGRVASGAVLTNRAYLTIGVTLQSVNGPAFTTIQGYQVPGTTYGNRAVRCAYLSTSAVLNGFTLTNGATLSLPITGFANVTGGGVYCVSSTSVVTNCVIAGNAAAQEAGGIFGGTVLHSVLKGNISAFGGAAYASALKDCYVIGNSAANNGGGLYGGSAINSAFAGNWAATNGGGIYQAPATNCTFCGNIAGSSAGGAYGSSLANCILYFNTAPTGSNYSGGTLNFCCASPMPPAGTGNITNNPQLASKSHLSTNSPCIGAGTAAYATGVDIDGQSWAHPPSIGCDEVYVGAVTGPLTVAIQEDNTNVSTIFPMNFTAQIGGPVTVSVWNFGDGTIVTNQPFASHTWAVPGVYNVQLVAFNDSYPSGVVAGVVIYVVSPSVFYVDVNSTNPLPPYSAWATAATNIQSAVDAASRGSIVLVANGVYNTGARAVFGSMSNRVAITIPILVQSVNGPAVTTIQGNQVAGTLTGSSAVRCAYLTNGAVMSGFTLMGGATIDAAEFHQGSGGAAWMQSASAIVSNCVITGNTAWTSGGGVFGGTVFNSLFLTNSAGSFGGGACSNIVYNSAFIANQASQGGAAHGTALNNCTATGNSANGGGGVDSCTLNNSLIYYNSALSQVNYSSSVFNYSCTVPLPAGGIGNIDAEPLLADSYHLAADSPCRGDGNPSAIGVDIDGEVWLNPPSIGCDEFYASTALGALNIQIQTLYTNVASGFALNLTGQITGNASSNEWNFGDGTVADNRPYVAHSWANQGTYTVTFTVYNNDNPGGISATTTVDVVNQPVSYVDPNSTTQVPPYSTWGTAATNIQDAVNAAAVGGTVLVTNGYFPFGATYLSGSNRLTISKPLTVQSVNGPSNTIIDGLNSVRCVYVTSGATLSGFTLTNGTGGGVSCQSVQETVSNCVITGNSGGGANEGTINDCLLIGNTTPTAGGGAAGCILSNCTIRGNSSGFVGGGAASCTLYNCTLENNTVNDGQGAGDGGGAFGCTLNNCFILGNQASDVGGGATGSSILTNCVVAGNTAYECGGTAFGADYNCTVVGNSALYYSGGVFDGVIRNCIVYDNTGDNYESDNIGIILDHCCTTPLPGGSGNITNDPAFENLAGGNYHLQSNSPCINSGYNSFVGMSTDLDSNPRIVGGTVDIGAYEYQTPTSVISYAWLQQYGLPTDGSVDYADLDRTSFNVYQDWRAGLNPTNPASVLVLYAPSATNTTGLTVTWQSVNTRSYYLQSSTNLAAQPPFSTIQSNILGLAGTTSYTDTTATNGGPYFYRVGVQY